MRTTNYDVIVEGVAQRLGVTPQDLQKSDEEPLRRFFRESLREVWTSAWWIDIVMTQRRYFRSWYSSAKSYVAGDIIYQPQNGKYYQALRSVSAVAPPNLSYWAEAVERPSGQPWDPTTQYAQGDAVAYVDHFFVAHSVPPVGATPQDPTYWGQVIPFIRVIPWDCSGYVSNADVQSGEVPTTCTKTHLWNTLAEMRADTVHFDNCYGILLGEAAKYDLKPIRQYSFSASSMEADNGREVIRPDDIDFQLPGRWKQTL